MRALVSYSRPRGKYGRYIFTVMIYFSEPTETATIEVKRPEEKTQTYTVYSCGYCGRWASITTHQSTIVHTSIKPTEHQKGGLLELYRYDNVEPDDFIDLTLSDSDLLKYQVTRVAIGWDSVTMKSYGRYPRYDKLRTELAAVQDNQEYYQKVTGKSATFYSSERGYITTSEYNNWLKEQQRKRAELAEAECSMTTEFLYPLNLLNWDEYVEARPTDMGEMRVEEDLIRQTMNAETITIKELVLEPVSQTLAIEGEKRFIDGEFHYLQLGVRLVKMKYRTSSFGDVPVEAKDRLEGTYIIGKTGSGKSTLLQRLVHKEITNGFGVCLIDSHGTMVDALLGTLPQEALDRTVLLDLTDKETVFGLNLFDCPDLENADEWVARVLRVFNKVWGVGGVKVTGWGATLEDLLRNIANTLIENPGMTLAEVPMLLRNKDVRAKLVANVTNPDVKYY